MVTLMHVHIQDSLREDEGLTEEMLLAYTEPQSHYKCRKIEPFSLFWKESMALTGEWNRNDIVCIVSCNLIQINMILTFIGVDWIGNLVMDSPFDNNSAESRELGNPSTSSSGFHRNGNFVSIFGEVEAKHRLLLVQWLTSLIPSLNFPLNVTDGELRACLSNGTVLCQILNRLRPGTVNMVSEPDSSLPSQSENVKTFLKALDAMGLPRFEISDLEKGSMKAVVDCLLTLRAKSLQNALGDNSNTPSSRVSTSSNFQCSTLGGEQRRVASDSKLQRVFSSPTSSLKFLEQTSSLLHHVGHKFHEVFQLKSGSYADIHAAKTSEMMKSNSLDHLMWQNAPTQSLLSVVNGILDESVERKNGEIPHRVACLLKKVIQEIERRMSTQAEHLRTQNNLFKAREEKYQSRIRVLDALASGTRDESEGEKAKGEEKKVDETEVVRLIKLQEDQILEISALKRELETAKRTFEVQLSQLEAELRQKSQEYENQLEELRNKAEKIKEEEKKRNEEEAVRSMKEREDRSLEIAALNQELETTKETYQAECSKLEGEAKGAKEELKQKSQEYEHRLEELRNTIKELEASSDSKHKKWNMQMNQLQTVVKFQFSSLQTLKLSWESVKQDVMKEQTVYAEEFDQLGVNLKSLVHEAENYHVVLAENKKLFNEVQELKGNIRVYCRIRPSLSGKKEKKSIVEHVGENDLIVGNPSREGKDSLRPFMFNKVFGPATTQAEVYSDIQSLVRSALDGYNVCIFAYGQTGSGKTYTMTGPTGATSETMGVNYRALNDLFKISTDRANFVAYDIGVQMVEIYNEQVRDLLTTDVPDASLFPVKSPADVIKLMEIGLKNRAIGATAMNERSSRSHSVVSINVRGNDLKSGSTTVGNLHLVDLAGSERVDRSEVTGDRLKEAQHINKSLSALGDVIFALSQKSPHIPYRNSKLTQLLQTSLGGQAKALMFVQINSDVNSFSETLSTLKFAERVSGVELGAARSSKETKDVRELMEQVASLKNTIVAKDEEIERLHLLKGSFGSIHKQNQKPPRGSDKYIEADTQQQSMDDHIHQNEFLNQSELLGRDIGKDIAPSAETMGYADADLDERSSDLSDNGVATGTDTDGSEYSCGTKSSDKMEKSKATPKSVQATRKSSKGSSITNPFKDLLKPSGIRKSISGHFKPPKRWQ
ncbi:hypothetical protein VNO77_00212 [Canavalia gladiata]|uniref:Uncharacterized protein n=1 Tax=Canavalia gladiata TaxID=3824 RepID=A0AAN9MP07_CANGL